MAQLAERATEELLDSGHTVITTSIGTVEARLERPTRWTAGRSGSGPNMTTAPRAAAKKRCTNVKTCGKRRCSASLKVSLAWWAVENSSPSVLAWPSRSREATDAGLSCPGKRGLPTLHRMFCMRFSRTPCVSRGIRAERRECAPGSARSRGRNETFSQGQEPPCGLVAVIAGDVPRPHGPSGRSYERAGSKRR